MDRFRSFEEHEENMISVKGGTATYDTPLREYVAQIGDAVVRVKTLDGFKMVVNLTEEETALLEAYREEQEAAHGSNH